MTGRSDFTLFETLPAVPQPWMRVRTLCLFLAFVALLLLIPEGLQRWRAMKLAEKIKQHGGMVRFKNSLLDQLDWVTIHPQAHAFSGNVRSQKRRPEGRLSRALLMGDNNIGGRSKPGQP